MCPILGTEVSIERRVVGEFLEGTEMTACEAFGFVGDNFLDRY
jgi:hypothetical protein